MYFNKAEGCYKYNPPVCVCVCVFVVITSLLFFKKNKTNFITNEQQKLSGFLHLYTSFSPLEEMLV